MKMRRAILFAFTIPRRFFAIEPARSRRQSAVHRPPPRGEPQRARFLPSWRRHPPTGETAAAAHPIRIHRPPPAKPGAAFFQLETIMSFNLPTTSLPPFTPILSALIADLRLPASLFRSYARLYAAAWAFAYQRTAELDFASQLVPLLGVSRSQARQHLRLLRGAGLITWSSDGNQRYVIHFSAPPVSVVGVNSLNDKNVNIQQQHTLSEKKDPADPNFSSAQFYLRRAGVWPGVAERLAQKIAANMRANHSSVGAANNCANRAANGEAADTCADDLPDLGDVLGWIAYCVSDREKNHIGQPAAVIAANLNAGRRCPENYRAPRICANCHGSEGYCECEGEPEYGYPPEFLARALRQRSGYENPYATRWGECFYCHAAPCQCHQDESE